MEIITIEQEEAVQRLATLRSVAARHRAKRRELRAQMHRAIVKDLVFQNYDALIEADAEAQVWAPLAEWLERATTAEQDPAELVAQMTGYARQGMHGYYLVRSTSFVAVRQHDAEHAAWIHAADVIEGRR